MFKVKNQKCIKRLANRTFRSNRTRNIIAMIAIILTTTLFTSLFTIGSGAAETLQYTTMLQAGGSMMGTIKYADPSLYEQLKAHPLIASTGYRQIVAESVDNPEFLKRRVEIYYENEAVMEQSFIKLKEGKLPEKADEIMMDSVSLKLLGIEYEQGKKVELILNIKGKEEKREFKLSGYFDPASYSFNVGFAIVSKAYTAQYKEELTNTYKEDGYMAGSVMYDLVLHSEKDMIAQFERIVEDCGYSNDEEADNYLSSNVNWAYLSNSIEISPTVILAVGGAVLLIVLTGYLIIYNIFQISVIKDIRFYGLLKTIGTTGRQIKKIINRQAAEMSLFGIPVGLIVGLLLGKAILPVVMSIGDIPIDTKFTINPWIFIGSAVFSLFTVFISTRKPGKIAASVSPVEAVNYTDRAVSIKTGDKKSTDGGKIYKMAFSNLSRNRKRTVLVVISLSLSILLLNSILTMTGSFDMDKYLSTFVDTDFLIAHAEYFNSKYRGEEERLSDSFIETVKAQEGFEEGGKLYCDDMFSVNDPSLVLQDENGDNVNKLGQYINTDENLLPTSVLYGLEELPLGRMKILEGELDPKVLKEKLSTGKYVVLGVQTDDYNVPYSWSAELYQIGDKVKLLNRNDNTSYEVEVIAKMEISYYTNSMRSWGADYIFYTDDKGYELLGGSSQNVMSYVFQFQDDKEEEMLQFLKKYTDLSEPLMSYESREKWINEYNTLKNMFNLVGGIMAVIIGIIGILNFINAIITSVITRKKEFAMLKAIGMTEKQLKAMVCLEGSYYSLGIILFSLFAGAAFSLLVIKNMHLFFFMTYHFIFWPTLITIPFLLVMGPLVPYLILAASKHDSIVEQLKEE